MRRIKLTVIEHLSRCRVSILTSTENLEFLNGTDIRMVSSAPSVIKIKSNTLQKLEGYPASLY